MNDLSTDSRESVIARVSRLIRAVKSYRHSDYSKSGIAKVWNNGNWRLDLCFVDEELGVVFVNSWLANVGDCKRISDTFPEFEQFLVSYGYPLYYTKTFRAHAREQYDKVNHKDN